MRAVVAATVSSAGSVVGCELLERAVRGLRRVVGGEEPAGVAEVVSSALPAHGWVDPVVPDDALQVPLSPLPPERAERLLEALRLPRRPPVDGAVGVARSPGELGEPDRGPRVVIPIHHLAVLVHLECDQMLRRGVGVESAGLEVALHSVDAIEVLEEVPGADLGVSGHPPETDLRLGIRPLDGLMGELEQTGVVAWRIAR